MADEKNETTTTQIDGTTPRERLITMIPHFFLAAGMASGSGGDVKMAVIASNDEGVYVAASWSHLDFLRDLVEVVNDPALSEFVNDMIAAEEADAADKSGAPS